MYTLCFAGAALTEDLVVQVHLLDEGVYVGRKSHQVPEDKVNIE